MYSLGVAHWLLRRSGAAPRSCWSRASSSFRRARRLARADPVPAEHRRDRAPATRRRGPGCGSCSRRRCSRSSRSRCDAAVGYVLANQADDRARRAASSCGRATLLDESASAFARLGDERGPGGRARAPRLPRARPRARSTPARAALERALELRRGHGDRRGVGLALAGLGLIETDAGDYEQRRAAPGRGARHLPPRRRPLGAGEHAVAHRRPRVRARDASTTPRRRSRRRARCSATTERAGWIANTLAGLAEVPSCAATRERAARRCSSVAARALRASDAAASRRRRAHRSAAARAKPR